jgi:hypothetical protein
MLKDHPEYWTNFVENKLSITSEEFESIFKITANCFFYWEKNIELQKNPSVKTEIVLLPKTG